MDEDYICFDLKDYDNSDLPGLRKRFEKASRTQVDCDQCEIQENYDNLNSLIQGYCPRISYIQLTNLNRIFRLSCLRNLPISIKQIHCYIKEAEERAVSNAEAQQFPNLFEFRELRALTLSGFKLAENSLRGIEELKNLYFLDLTDSLVPTGELNRLKNLTKLKHLYLSSCRLDDKSITSLLMSNKNLQALDINSNPEITDRTMEKLCTLPDIRILNIMNLTQITDYYLEEMRNLTSINCQNCPKISEPGLIKLISLTVNLRYLDVRKCRVSNELLEAALEIVKTRECKRSLEIAVDRLLKNEWNARYSRIMWNYCVYEINSAQEIFHRSDIYRELNDFVSGYGISSVKYVL